MNIKTKRLHNIKRYESSLRKSLQSSLNTQNTSFRSFIQNPLAYQFKHFQVSNKSLNSKNLTKKTSLSHLTKDTSQKRFSMFKTLDFFKVFKIQKEKFEEGVRRIATPVKNSCLIRSADVKLPKRYKTRPKSVSPISGKREIISNSVKESEGKINRRKLRVFKVKICQPDIEITPW